MECEDFYLGCTNTTEDNTGATRTVKKGNDKNYSHTKVVGCIGFEKNDTGASYSIQGGENTSLNVTEVIASKDVIIKENGARKEVCGKGGPGTTIASTVVKDGSGVTIEGKNKEAIIRRERPEGAILAEKVILGSEVTKKEYNSKVTVSSGTGTANSS